MKQTEHGLSGALSRMMSFSLALSISMAQLLLTTSGCRMTVPLSLNRFVPKWPPGTEAYRGKRIVIEKFRNATGAHEFHGYGGRISYDSEEYSLDELFRGCVGKYLGEVGMKALNSAPVTERVPSLSVALQFLSDTLIRFSARLKVGSTVVLRRSYTVRGKPDHTAWDRVQLESNVYSMINKMIHTIIADRRFRSAYFGTSPAPTATPTPGPVAPRPTHPTSRRATGSQNIRQRLQQLKRLYQEKLITKEEFERKRKALIEQL